MNTDPGLVDPGDLRLLRHHLRDEDGPRIARRADAQRPRARPVPGQQGRPGSAAADAPRKAVRTARYQDHPHPKVSEPSSPDHPHSLDGRCTICMRMPYRPQKRRASRTGNGNGNGTHHRGSYAARLAIARSTARKKGSSGPHAVIVLLLILMVSGVTVASAAAITAGGAAAVTIATLDEGLPDVASFRDIDFNEQTVMYDRATARSSWRSSGTNAARSSTSRTSPRSCSTPPPRPRTTPSGTTRASTSRPPSTRS